jgi:hypothetical protein
MIIQPDNIASLRAIASVAPSRVLGTVARIKVLSWMRSRYRALSAPVPIEVGVLKGQESLLSRVERRIH